MMGRAGVLLVVARWCSLLVALVINAMLVRVILEDYPEARRHPQYPTDHLSTVRRLEGPDLGSIEAQIANLSLNATSVCVDYRTLGTLLSKEVQNASNHSPALALAERGFRRGLTVGDMSDVRRFVFFVGYPRSGHSIVGSMLDAHPNAIIAHEYNLFRLWANTRSGSNKHSRSHLFNALFKNSVESATTGWRSKDKVQKKGYSLEIEHQWQAKFQKLLVIGDKSGAVTTQLYESDPEKFLEMLKELKQTVGVPVRVIHVVRNPYDIISTRLLYADGTGKVKIGATEERRHCNDYGLHYHINRTFHMMSSIHSLVKRTKLTVLDVHLADLVRAPRQTVAMICRFLGLVCSEDYLTACEGKVFQRLSKTRLLVHWPQAIIDRVQQLSTQYSFLWRYSFSGD